MTALKCLLSWPGLGGKRADAPGVQCLAWDEKWGPAGSQAKGKTMLCTTKLRSPTLLLLRALILNSHW